MGDNDEDGTSGTGGLRSVDVDEEIIIGRVARLRKLLGAVSAEGVNGGRWSVVDVFAVGAGEGGRESKFRLDWRGLSEWPNGAYGFEECNSSSWFFSSSGPETHMEATCRSAVLGGEIGGGEVGMVIRGVVDDTADFCRVWHGYGVGVKEPCLEWEEVLELIDEKAHFKPNRLAVSVVVLLLNDVVWDPE
jgi:hypothetical protein